MKRSILFLTPLLLLFSFPIITEAQLSYELLEGEIDSSPYKIAVPENWADGKVFFHVHGWRPADAPHEANLNPDDPFYQSLLNDGWLIARTASIQNGADHETYTQSIYELKEWIESNTGQVQLTILEGESTAGTLVLQIAENNPDLADGVIAMGAFVELNDPDSDSFLRANPEIPAILMSNLTELDGPVAYAAKAENAAVQPILRPLLRPGHVNANHVERYDALKELQSRVKSGDFSTITDGTRQVPARETETIHENGSIINQITTIDWYFGNLELGFHPDEFADLGIEQGQWFILEIDGQQRDVFYGESYGDVEQGQWVAFPHANDHILVARNHEHAANTVGVQVGNRIKILPK